MGTATRKFRQLVNALIATNSQKQITASKMRTVLQESASAIDEIYDNLAVAESIGEYSALTGVAYLSEDGSTSTPGQTPSFPDGKYFDVVVDGVQEITGIPVSMAIGGKIIVRGDKWGYIPPSDLALRKVQKIEETVQPTSVPNVLFPFFDKKKRILMGFNTAGQWFASRFVPKSIPREALGALSVTREDLDSGLAKMVFQTLDPLSGYIFGILARRKKLIMIKTDGSVEIPKLIYRAIATTDLGSDVKSLMWQKLDPITGYIGGIFDKKKRKLIAIKTDGQVEIPRLVYTPVNGSINELMLSASVISKLESGGSNINARLLAPDDELNRGGYVDIAVKLSYNGSQFVPFRRVRTPFIQGINKTGQTLEFRRSSGLTCRARKYVGTYDVPAINEVSYKGDTNSAPPTAGRLAGDWFRIGTLDKATLTINGVAYQSGDIAVWDGVSAFVRKAAPSASGESRSGDFWVVTTAGVFDGISYGVGDVIFMESRRAAGGPFYRYYNKGNNSKGEFFFAGSFTPASFTAPAAIANGVKYQSSADPVVFDAVADGMVYIASAAGTYDSKNFAKNDMLVRIAGAWSLLASEPVKTVLNNEFISLRCDFANEWEVRRADVANTGYGGSALSVILKSAQSFVPKSSVTDLVIDGDSMVGALATLPALLAPRVVTTRSWGGGTSEDIVNEIEREIRKTDSYKARAHGFYHGQNNVNDLGQILYMCDRMIELAGARDATFFFLSVLGDRYMTYNGTRMVATMQEGAFAQDPNNAVFKIEQAYEQKYKGNWINIRKHILASAATLTEPDLLQPGKTQAQMAAELGQLPLSYFLDYTTLPYPAGQLVHVGYQTVDATPTGGTDKDYYIATYGEQNAATVGALWIRSAGVWNLYTWDRVHVLPSARPLFAQAVQNWLSTNKL